MKEGGADASATKLSQEEAGGIGLEFKSANKYFESRIDIIVGVNQPDQQSRKLKAQYGLFANFTDPKSSVTRDSSPEDNQKELHVRGAG